MLGAASAVGSMISRQAIDGDRCNGIYNSVRKIGDHGFQFGFGAVAILLNPQFNAIRFF